ncbi:MAG TPA: winged helix-turn-helix domain-containing protein [Candidatus Dormibacteraeota bacterium]|nr:winged helix-turn-helix domain-containing protein [Candidatus Dormibacteraeota bacterium]
MPTNQHLRTAFAFGPFRLDAGDLVLRRGDEEIPLTRKAVQTLLVLVENAGHVMGKDTLLERVWPGTFVNESTLAQNILTLRKALGKQVGGEDYICTVPKRGYRFEASVTESASAGPAIWPSGPVREPHGDTRGAPLSQQPILYALLTVGVVIAISAVYLARSRSIPAAANIARTKIQSIAVLSLTNLSGDPSQDYLADGITEAITTDLAKFRSLRVVSRTSAMQYNGRKKPLPEIARELHVDAIVEGSMMRSGAHVRVTAQLSRAANDEQIWAESYEREVRDLLALQNDVARDIAEHVQAQITTQDRQRLATARSLDPAAHEEYVKGRFFWNKRTENGYLDAIDHFLRAIQIDPEYPEPYAGLADSYALLGSLGGASIPRRDAMNNARSIARKALELDPAMAEAHTSLAFVLMHYDWDFAAAEQEYLRAIDLNPNYATAHQWYAINLAATGRMDAALAELRHAQELDPLSLIISADIGELLGWARRYEDAAAQLQSTLQMDPNFLLAHSGLVTIYQYQQKYAEAADHARKAMELAAGSLWAQGLLGSTYALNGQRDKARKVMASMERSPHGSEAANHLAMIATDLGDKDAAFHWLQVARDERSGSLILLKIVPYWDPLRSDPRFLSLLHDVGLDSTANSD